MNRGEDAKVEYETQSGKTLLQEDLGDPRKSGLRKYQDINVGSRRILDLVKYELFAVLLAPLPGAVGLLLRKLFAPLLLGAVGHGVVIGRSCTVRHPAKIHLGDGAMIDDYAVLDAKGATNRGIFVGRDVLVGRNTVLSCKNGDIFVGNGSNIAMNCFIQSGKNVTIGEKVLFAAYCYIIGGGTHRSERVDVPVMDQGQSIDGIVIGDHAWLGAGAKVMDGVEIGRDAIIGAGAVVTRDVPPYHVAAGVPARNVRDRRAAPQNEAMTHHSDSDRSEGEPPA